MSRPSMPRTCPTGTTDRPLDSRGPGLSRARARRTAGSGLSPVLAAFVHFGSFVFLVGLALGVAGCASPDGSPQPFEPKTVQPEGTYRHAYIALEIPERSGPFQRTHVTVYDPLGADVSGHYASGPDLPIAATIYVYPATPDASSPSREQFVEHFEQTKSDVFRVSPGSTLVRSGGVDGTMNGLELSGAHAQYALPSYPGLSGEVDSHLYLFVLDGWYVKFRFTHPMEVAEEAIALEQEFIASTTWPLPE